MAKNIYLLISVVGHKISTKPFASLHEAREAMLTELGVDVLRCTNLTNGEWKSYLYKRRYAYSDKFAFELESAWSDLDKQNPKSWKIVSDFTGKDV